MNKIDNSDHFHRPGNSLLLGFIRGAIGKEYVVKRYGNRRIITKYPDLSNVIPSAKQVENRSRFKEAVAFAKKVMADRELTAEIKRLTRCGKYVSTAAIKYFFKQQRLREAKASMETSRLLQAAFLNESIKEKSIKNKLDLLC